MIAETMLGELEHEAATTRRLLERIPEDKLDWKPHTKSMSLRELASHTATLVEWAKPILGQDELEMSGDYQPWLGTSRAEILDAFDQKVALAKTLLPGYPDEKMLVTWTLKAGDKVYVSMPRLAVMRGFVLSHLVHHRGQLSVYLRLNDVPVPSIYGPSADEA